MLPNVMLPAKLYFKGFFCMFLLLAIAFSAMPLTSHSATIAPKDLRADRGFQEFDYGTTLLDPNFDIKVETPFSTECADPNPLIGLCLYKTVTCYISTPFTGCIWYGFKWNLFPTIEIVMKYDEPTVFLEVVSRRGHSMLDFEGDLPVGAINQKGSGAGGNFIKNAQYYEAHVWGIGPEGRIDSSLSKEVAGETMACDIADRLDDASGWGRTWSSTKDSRTAIAPADGMRCELIGDTTNLPGCEKAHRSFLKVLENSIKIANFLVGWQTEWFVNIGLGTPTDRLHLLYFSEDNDDDWNSKVNNDGSDNNFDSIAGVSPLSDSGMIKNCEIIQSLRVLSGMLQLFAPEIHFVPGCIGSWGSLLPRNGWYTSMMDNMSTKALIAWRAYDRAITELPPFLNFAFYTNHEKYNPRSIYPNTLVPKTTNGFTGAQGYYATKFNLEWPHHMTSRKRIGTDTYKWSGLSKEMDYKTETVPDFLMRLAQIQAYLGAGIALTSIPESTLPKDDLVEDGLIMTLWKKTECCVATCSNPYYYKPSYFVADGKDWNSPNKMFDIAGALAISLGNPSYPWAIRKYRTIK